MVYFIFHGSSPQVCLIYAEYMLFCSNTTSQDLSSQLAVSQDDSLSKSRSEEIPNKQVTFRDHISNNEMDDSDMERHQNGREPSPSWHSKSSPYTNPLEDLNSHSPYLPPVMEEPASSFSEGENSVFYCCCVYFGSFC